MFVILAHGIQGRADLPIPALAFYWAATVVLLLSFAALAAGWKSPRCEGLLERYTFSVDVERTLRRLRTLGQAMSVLLLIAVGVAALCGSTDLNSNIAPTAVFVVWWIGIALCAAAIGDVWRALHPVGAIATWLHLPDRTGRIPCRVGVWPAFFGMLAFTWCELVYSTAANVRLLGWLIVSWAVVTLASMARFGIEETLDHIEPFTLYTRLLGGLGVIGSVGHNKIAIRPPVLGVIRTSSQAGLAPFMGMLIGSISYDGLSRTFWWKQAAASNAAQLYARGVNVSHAQLAIGTVGFVGMILLATIAFLGASRLAALVGCLPLQGRYGAIETAFAPTLIPIVIAYVVAHYISFFWFQSQQLVRLISDPLGRGSDWFGTSGFVVDYTTLSAETIWIVQILAITLGHVVALALAHDRALELAKESKGQAVCSRAWRSQLPMLALMILYTVGGLYFLSEGLQN